jgi:hypothetical protein
MTSHEVQDALNITARERIRWTKDGRLRTSGTFTARRQQVVTFSTYAVAYIEALSLRTETIEAWREADRDAAVRLPKRKDP